MTLTNLENPIQQRREKLEILVEILNAAKNGSPKTQLMYKANLNFASINENLEFLIKNELLVKCSSYNKTFYKPTEKGQSFIELYFKLNELIDGNRLQQPQIRTPPLILLLKQQ
jgi:predicted transcriptional regulator